MKDFNFKDLLFFDKFVTPAVVTFIYWISIFGVVIGGFVEMFDKFITGLLIIIFGAISVRIYMEIIIVFFKINSNLEKIVKNTSSTDEKITNENINNEE